MSRISAFFGKLFSGKKNSSSRAHMTGAYAEREDKSLNEELISIFEKAYAANGKNKLTPVRLLATQVVAGINYRFECADEKGKKYTAVVYRDLQMNCRFTHVSDKKGNDVTADFVNV